MTKHASGRWVVVLSATVVAFSTQPWSTLRAEKIDEVWLKQVAALPAQKQVEAVVSKLTELNPGFDGKATHKIETGVVTEFNVASNDVTDISPVRGLSGLKTLHCEGNAPGKGKLIDLTPLKDVPLVSLYCGNSKVADLSPYIPQKGWRNYKANQREQIRLLVIGRIDAKEVEYLESNG